MHPDSITSYLNDFSKKYNLPHINPHAFRHSFSSILIADNVDPVTLANTLGHAKVSHTTDIYSHLIKEARSKTAKALSAALLQ